MSVVTEEDGSAVLDTTFFFFLDTTFFFFLGTPCGDFLRAAADFLFGVGFFGPDPIFLLRTKVDFDDLSFISCVSGKEQKEITK